VKHLLLMLAVAGFAIGVPAVASAQETVTVEVTSVVFVSPHEVLVTGTITCDQPVEGSLQIVLTGRIAAGRGAIGVPQPSTTVDSFSCSGETTFSVPVESVRALNFYPGQELNVYADYAVCTETGCDAHEFLGNFVVQR
jgi:hypothetical protein